MEFRNQGAPQGPALPAQENLAPSLPAPLPPLAAADAGELNLQVDRLLALSEQMSELLETEILLVKKRDQKEHSKLWEEKQRLLNDYQGAVKGLMGERGRIAYLSPEQRARLKVTGQRLDRTAAKNAENLAMAAAATQKVLQVVIDAVRREIAATRGYSAKAQGKQALSAGFVQERA